MLPAEARLRRSGEFQAVTRSGRRAGTPSLVVHLLAEPDTEAGTASNVRRAGFVVSRQVGPAVARNLVRRRLRHLVRDRLDRLPAGARLVVRAKPPARVAPAASLAADLDRALDRLLAAGPGGPRGHR